MKNLFKKATSLILAGVISFSAMAMTTFAAEGDTPTEPASATVDGYEFYYEIAGSDRPLTQADVYEPVVLWVNGGKSTLANGAIVDGKSTQVNLFENAGNLIINSSGDVSGSGYTNIALAKTTVMGISTTSAVPTLTNGKFTKDSDAEKIAKVAKGKVTAGKESGSVYVHAFTNVIKGSDGYTQTYAGCFKVTVKAAPTTIAAVNANSSGATIKSVNVPVGKSVTIYANPTLGTKTAPITPDVETTYTVVPTAKTAAFISIAQSNYTYEEITKTTGITITGVKLAGTETAPKIAKASFTITNDQSGKKASVTVNVANSILEIAEVQGDAITLSTTAATTLEYNAYAANTNSSGTAPLFKTALGTTAPTTDKITVSVSTDEKVTNITVDSKGVSKVKASSTNKPTNIKVKFDAKNGKLTITGTKLKAVDQKDTASSTTIYVAITTSDLVERVIPVTIISPAKAAATA